MKAIRYGFVLFVLLLSCRLLNLQAETTGVEKPAESAPLDHSQTAWQPVVGQSWQWQLTGEIDSTVDAEVYDLDLFETDSGLVEDLHRMGKRVICYINVGAWEDWREDASLFPERLLGADYAGWQGERWLDIHQIELLKPILQARFDLCKSRGFDAIEPDNIDGYTNETGFNLTFEDQLQYNRWLSEEAHARGLLIGLKNDPDQARDLVSAYDWAMTEDCFDQDWCEQVQVFTQAGKPVFMAEYTDTRIDFEAACAVANRLHFSLILKNRDLDVFLRACP